MGAIIVFVFFWSFIFILAYIGINDPEKNREMKKNREKYQKELESQTMFCPYCTEAIPIRSFCVLCGGKLEIPGYTSKEVKVMEKQHSTSFLVKGSIFIVFIIILGLGTIFFYLNYRDIQTQKFTACEFNLKNMATALDMYKEDNDGYYPSNLNVLRPLYTKDSYICPASNNGYAYVVSANYDNFTLWCAIPDAHKDNNPPDAPGCWPQYTPSEGVIVSP